MVIVFAKYQGLAQSAPVLNLGKIEAEDVPRFGTGIEEFDRVLGGGLVPGGVVLIGGDPGIGKSTLLLQKPYRVCRVLKKVLYVSGEESGAQIALRAKRLMVERMRSLCKPKFSGENPQYFGRS